MSAFSRASSPEVDEPVSPSKSISIARESKGEESPFSDEIIRNGHNRPRKNSMERASLLRRYRGSKRRSSIESLWSETDSQHESKLILMQYN